jgi:hypothetical protein
MVRSAQTHPRESKAVCFVELQDLGVDQGSVGIGRMGAVSVVRSLEKFVGYAHRPTEQRHSLSLWSALCSSERRVFHKNPSKFMCLQTLRHHMFGNYKGSVMSYGISNKFLFIVRSSLLDFKCKGGKSVLESSRTGIKGNSFGVMNEHSSNNG